MARRRTARSRRPEERRTNLTLRETLDELVQHVRQLARTLHELAPHEIEYAQQRLEWLADEIWRITIEAEADDEEKG